MLVTRPSHRASATTSNIYKVRCAGTPKPASNTYRNAANAPANAATFCAGSRKGSCQSVKNERRHSAPAPSANSPAIMVMCKPEIEIRWLTPVRLNTCQSDWGMARWSPTTSATITPAYCLPSRLRAMRARRAARLASTTLPKPGTKAARRTFGVSARGCGRT